MRERENSWSAHKLKNTQTNTDFDNHEDDDNDDEDEDYHHRKKNNNK